MCKTLNLIGFKDVKGGESEHINLKVLGQDNTVVQFKIKKHTPLRKLMSAYCERTVCVNVRLLKHVACLVLFVINLSRIHFFQGVAMNVVRFRVDGQAINESDTPAALDMEEGDTIEVFQQQTGGFLKYC